MPRGLGPQLRQRWLPRFEDARRRELRFKAAVVALTLAACAGLFGATTAGRHGLSRARFAARALALRAIGGRVDRTRIEADWRERRRFSIAMTRRLVRQVHDESGPKIQAFLRAAGMTADDGVLRWGNFDAVLLLSSRVFAPDDARSYRLRPNVRSVWLRNIVLPRSVSGFFLVPATEDVLSPARACGALEVPGSLQTTSSWGCRGPEPDTSADLRGLILGDSYMQGMFLGDDETPAACLERRLREATGGTVSILNTGHLGYSPEQYDLTLREYFDRFRPHFIVLSICGNDFGGGDWAESAYWLDRIWQFGRTRGVICLTIPMPDSLQVTGSRRIGWYQGRLAALDGPTSAGYLDPIDDFVDEHTRLTTEALRRGGPRRSSPLYNLHLGDPHVSAQGADVWARAVARRLMLLLERKPIRSAAPGTGPALSGALVSPAP